MESREAFLDQLDRMIAEQHLANHDFFRACAAGELSREALQAFARQYYRQVEALPSYLGAVYARCREVILRRKVLQNLLEKDWGKENHLELWIRFAAALGISREEVVDTPPLPETGEAITTLRELTLAGPASSAMAAVYACSAMAPRIGERLTSGLSRHYGVENERAFAYFAANGEEQREWNRAILGELRRSPDDTARCREAVSITTEALTRLLDGVYQHHVAN